jgi:5-methylcytosine-specific restriction endonuclease McrA
VIPDEEIKLRIKHEVVRHAKEIQQIRRELEAYENLEKVPSAKRERIPDNVRIFVWQRHEGRCVKCESRESLEFDHIIPVIEGGGNTERNIQLLCEACNRKKGRTI